MHTRTRRLRRGGLLVIGAALLGAACGEQVRDLEGAAVKNQLQLWTEAQLEENGIELDGSLTCAADATEDDTINGSCNGRTAEGDAVTGSIEGTVDLGDDEQQCRSTVTFQRGAEELDVDCFEEFGKA